MAAGISFGIDLANEQAGQHGGSNERRPDDGSER
jgi:hypothetical protein